MILQRLAEAAPRLLGNDQAPRGYEWLPVPWVVRLSAKGEFCGLIETREGKQGERRLTPNRKRSGTSPPPTLSTDMRRYVFGPKDGDPSIDDPRHLAYLDLLKRCLDATGHPRLRAVLDSIPAVRADAECARIEDNERVAFQVDGEDPVEAASVQQFWAQEISRTKDEAVSGSMCLVCGQRKPIPKVIEEVVRGLPGQPPAQGGWTLIGIKPESFMSFGLVQAKGSCVCADCGGLAVKALNRLIEDQRHHVRIGPLAYTFWTREPVEDPFWSMLSAPDPEAIGRLLTAYRRGRMVEAGDDGHFYATALSSNAARVVIRDWLETTVGTARRNMAAWFVRTGIVNGFGQNGEPLSVWQMARTLYRDANKEMTEHVPTTLIRAALHGDPLPPWVLAQAVTRCRAEQTVAYPRAALIKAALASNSSEDECTMSELTLTEVRPAYLCGRLLAVLEQIQRQAIQGINSTVVDRFYGAASTAPATVFGTLMGDAQNHLGKLRRTRPATHAALDVRLQSILDPLEAFPKTLTLQDQALFALGFYHQRASDRAQALAHRQQSETATEGDSNE